MTRPMVGSGATDAQIAAAVERSARSPNAADILDARQDCFRLARASELLVPPDHRIVAVSDLRRIRTIFAWSVADHGATEEDQLLLTRINALIGGDA